MQFGLKKSHACRSPTSRPSRRPAPTTDPNAPALMPVPLTSAVKLQASASLAIVITDGDLSPPCSQNRARFTRFCNHGLPWLQPRGRPMSRFQLGPRHARRRHRAGPSRGRRQGDQHPTWEGRDAAHALACGRSHKCRGRLKPVDLEDDGLVAASDAGLTGSDHGLKEDETQ